MKGLLNEFKTFAMRGNMIDMAVGIVIGVAFGKIVNSLVADVLMPPLNFMVSSVDFNDLKWVLLEAGEGHGSIVISYGAFIQSLVDFLIIAFAVFMVVKIMNEIKRKEAAEPVEKIAEPSPEVKLLTEIRDSLQKKKPAKRAQSSRLKTKK